VSVIRACAWSLVVSLSVLACVTVPETGRKQLEVIPDGYMNSLGAQEYADLKAQEKISSDARLTQAIGEVGRRIAKASGKGFAWEFTLFDSKEVNAFCLPGGKVGVYTGLLPVAKTNAGLAAVLGHEVAHAVARHGAERATQSLLVAGTLVTVDQVMTDPKRKQIVMAALGLGAQFGVMLPYSRAHESEADKIGLIYMARAGYDPAEAVELWHRMAKEGGASPPEILSTHPDPSRRADALRAQIPSVKGAYDASAKVPTAPI
jgi:predicted Zn-dependent protease